MAGFVPESVADLAGIRTSTRTHRKPEKFSHPTKATSSRFQRSAGFIIVTNDAQQGRSGAERSNRHRIEVLLNGEPPKNNFLFFPLRHAHSSR